MNTELVINNCCDSEYFYCLAYANLLKEHFSKITNANPSIIKMVKVTMIELSILQYLFLTHQDSDTIQK